MDRGWGLRPLRGQERLPSTFLARSNPSLSIVRQFGDPSSSGREARLSRRPAESQPPEHPTRHQPPSMRTLVPTEQECSDAMVAGRTSASPPLPTRQPAPVGRPRRPRTLGGSWLGSGSTQRVRSRQASRGPPPRSRSRRRRRGSRAPHRSSPPERDPAPEPEPEPDRHCPTRVVARDPADQAAERGQLGGAREEARQVVACHQHRREHPASPSPPAAIRPAPQPVPQAPPPSLASQPLAPPPRSGDSHPDDGNGGENSHVTREARPGMPALVQSKGQRGRDRSDDEGSSAHGLDARCSRRGQGGP
jgi:hypothetical protein